MEKGLTAEHSENLHRILSHHVNSFRRALRGNPPAKVEPRKIRVKPGVEAVIARLRRYDPTKSKWLPGYIAVLTALDLVIANLHAVWAFPAILCLEA